MGENTYYTLFRLCINWFLRLDFAEITTHEYILIYYYTTWFIDYKACPIILTTGEGIFLVKCFSFNFEIIKKLRRYEMNFVISGRIGEYHDMWYNSIETLHATIKNLCYKFYDKPLSLILAIGSKIFALNASKSYASKHVIE